MKLILTLGCTLCLSVTMAQSAKTEVQKPKAATEQSSNVTFEQFCVSNAVSVLDTPSKEDISYAGSKTLIENGTYIDYKVQLLEETTQYFTLEGTDKILVVSSLYRLRLAFDATKK